MLPAGLSLDETFNTLPYLHSNPLDYSITHSAASPDTCASPGGLCWGKAWRGQTALHPPGVTILYYCWIRVFGDSELSIHIPAFIAGLLSVIAMYLLARLIIGPQAALFASLALVLSPAHIGYSTQAVHAIFELSIFLFSLLFFAKFILTRKSKYFILLNIANILGVMTFYHYQFFLFFQLLTFLALKIKKKIAVSAAYFFLWTAVMILFLAIPARNFKDTQLFFWPKNDLFLTIKNIANLPRYFYQ